MCWCIQSKVQISVCSSLSCDCFYSPVLLCSVGVLSNVFTLPVLSVMNVWTIYCFIGSLLTLCRLWLLIELIFWVMNCVSHISGGVYALVHYYKTEVPKVFLASKQQFNFRCLVASCICILMGVISSCGIGLLLVLALTSSRRSFLYFLIMKYAFTIPLLYFHAS